MLFQCAFSVDAFGNEESVLEELAIVSLGRFKGPEVVGWYSGRSAFGSMAGTSLLRPVKQFRTVSSAHVFLFLCTLSEMLGGYVPMTGACEK
jgi:hypothetical protein